MAAYITVKYKRKVQVISADTIQEVKNRLGIKGTVNAKLNGRRTPLHTLLENYQTVEFAPRTKKK